MLSVYIAARISPRGIDWEKSRVGKRPIWRRNESWRMRAGPGKVSRAEADGVGCGIGEELPDSMSQLINFAIKRV